ncbi:MAG: hypothetical protein P8H31_05020 [Porticoccaceae bacterium]|nr:hypothetical protein [Porticoccaceae bacterium]
MNKITKSIAALILLVSFSTVSLAAGWVADFNFDADATYDDNFLMNEAEQDSWIYSIKPEASLIYLSPVVKSELDAKLAVKRYSEFDQFDSEDPAFNWKNSYKKERSTWSLDFGYSENSQRDFADQDTGQFDSNTIVETVYVDPGVVFRVTEKDDLGISFGYTERDYNADDFSDNEDQTIGLNWQHKVDQVLSTTANISVSQYEAERPNVNTNKTDYEKITVGFIYQYSESLSINGSTGYFQSDSRKRILSGPVVLIVDSDNTGVLLNLGMNYSQESNDWSLSLSRSLYPSSQGDVEERDSVRVGFEHRYTSRSSAGINLSWYDTDSALNDRESINISPYYHYRITEKLKLQTSYVFRSYDRNSGSEVESNRVKIGLRYSF